MISPLALSTSDYLAIGAIVAPLTIAAIGGLIYIATRLAILSTNINDKAGKAEIAVLETKLAEAASKTQIAVLDAKTSLIIDWMKQDRQK